jgi:hypothetical protein
MLFHLPQKLDRTFVGHVVENFEYCMMLLPYIGRMCNGINHTFSDCYIIRQYRLYI